MSENHKKVWITGASSGIGKAVAEKFAKEGWKVAVSARRREILEDMANNDKIFSYPLDVTNQDQVNSTFEKIVEDFGDDLIYVFFQAELTILRMRNQSTLIRLRMLLM